MLQFFSLCATLYLLVHVYTDEIGHQKDSSITDLEQLSDSSRASSPDSFNSAGSYSRTVLVEPVLFELSEALALVASRTYRRAGSSSRNVLVDPSC